MARTKQEVRDFLNSQVGQKVNAKAGIYNGQCVSLIKALLEFLGVDNPYGARGNAKDVGDTLLRQGIATNGPGWLQVVVNRSMGNIGGVNYGHIWLDLSGEANFEQNGARALFTTKNTRPIQQAQQVINLDKYIRSAPAPKPQPEKEKPVMLDRNGAEVLYKFYFGSGVSEYGNKNRIGKQTFAQAQSELLNSPEYKAHLEELRQNQTGFVAHLPSTMQQIVKLPEQIK